ncbi:MAG: TIGR03084 family metal-binding protein [Desulfobacterales bacterium]
MKNICRDLKAEHEALDAFVSDFDENQWMTMTPSPGWNIKDQLCHLAYFDGRAALSIIDPGAFNKHLADIMADMNGFIDMMQHLGKDMAPADVIRWWRDERKNMLEAYAGLHPKDRLVWYGPPMSALSSATARLMETWAHGQDVFDAVKVKRTNTDRLRHIAHLGVTTFKWSYINRGLEVPETAIRVELSAPSGDVWTWGPEGVADGITGPAEDFCLVVAQRRHVDDTRLVVTGAAARDWMEKAQCFAGPATAGPAAGERIWE